MTSTCWRNSECKEDKRLRGLLVDVLPVNIGFYGAQYFLYFCRVVSDYDSLLIRRGSSLGGSCAYPEVAGPSVGVQSGGDTRHT